MRSKNNNPGSLDSYVADIRDLLPAVDALMSRHGTTKLRDYVEILGQKQSTPLQCGQDFVTEVENYTRETLGPETARAVAEELREASQVLTANHHGIDSFAQSTQSNLLFSLRKRGDGSAAKTIPVLACGTVPLNNLTYPRGLLIYACNQAPGDAGICKLPVFPDSYKRKLVSFAEPFTAKMLDRARARAGKLCAGGTLTPVVKTAVDTILDDFAQIAAGFPGYARQATVANHRLWQRLFRDRRCRSELVYVELETIACRLLRQDLVDRASICHQLLFDPGLRRRLIERLDGQQGCWQTGKLSRRVLEPPAPGMTDSATGTMFFWGVDTKGRQVPLCVVEDRSGTGPLLRGVDGSGNSWTIPLTPGDIARELEARRLLPSIFTSYLLIAIARGVNCIGGYYQADYLPAMQHAVARTLQNGSGNPARGFNGGAIGPDLYLSGMQTVGLRTGDRLLPAGPVEIIASGGLDEDQYQRIGEVTVTESHIASLFDIVLDVAPANHELHRIKQEILKLVNDRIGSEIVSIAMDSSFRSP